jgi:hypothetical protein
VPGAPALNPILEVDGPQEPGGGDDNRAQLHRRQDCFPQLDLVAEHDDDMVATTNAVLAQPAPANPRQLSAACADAAGDSHFLMFVSVAVFSPVALQIDTRKVCPGEIRPRKVRPHEIAIAQVGTIQVRPEEHRAGQVGAAQAGPSQQDVDKVAAHQVRIAQVVGAARQLGVAAKVSVDVLGRASRRRRPGSCRRRCSWR